MAIAVEIVAAYTLKQYEEALAELGLRLLGTSAPGAYFHWAAEQEDGRLRVVEVWESRETFEIFLGNLLAPALGRIGVTALPDLTFYEVHNYLTPPGYPASVSALPSMWTNPLPVADDEDF